MTIPRMAITIINTEWQANDSVASNRLTPIPPAPTNPITVEMRTLMSHRQTETTCGNTRRVGNAVEANGAFSSPSRAWVAPNYT